MGQMHQIGEVADAVGLSLRTIRHYEEVGLVPPSGRSPGGFRLYTDDDIERLRLVKAMKPLDFMLEEMRQLLDALDARDRGDDQPSIVERIAMFAALARHRCDRLRDQLDAAEAMAAMLQAAQSAGPRSGTVAG